MFIFLFLILLLLLILHYKHWYKFREIKKFPGPTPLPLIGNVLDFDKSRRGIFEFMTKLNQKYGEIVRLYVSLRAPTVVITDPHSFEKILSSTENLEKSDMYDLPIRYLGNGILVSSPEIWRVQRKMLTPMFHFKILEEFIVIFNKNRQILIEKLSNFNEQPVDISIILKLYSLDNILETSMGISINAQSNENHEYVHAGEEFFDIIIERYYSLFKRFDWYNKIIGLYQREMKCVHVMQTFTKNAIKMRKQLRDNLNDKSETVDDLGRKRKICFIDLLLNLAEENKVNEQDVLDEVNTMVSAGLETVSTAISILLYIISKYPDIQQKLYDEIMSELPNENDMTIANLNKLKYMDCVIKESMRLFPSAPIIERRISTPVEIGGVMLPQGTIAQLFIYGLHRNPKHYDQPETFNPERFTLDNCLNRHPYAFAPFSAGSRNCIGQKYAWIVMKSTLVSIVKNFVIERKPGFEWILSFDFVLKSDNGVYLIFRKR